MRSEPTLKLDGTKSKQAHAPTALATRADLISEFTEMLFRLNVQPGAKVGIGIDVRSSGYRYRRTEFIVKA